MIISKQSVLAALIVGAQAFTVVPSNYNPPQPEVEHSGNARLSEDVGSDLEPDGLAIDAAVYADMFGLSAKEALARLKDQQTLDSISPELRHLAGDSLAGMYFTHDPSFGLVIRIVDKVPEQLLARVESVELPISIVRADQLSLSELVRIVGETEWEHIDPGIQGVYVEERSGDIVVQYLGEDVQFATLKRSLETLPWRNDVDLRFERLKAPASDVNRGGRILTTCTSSFTVSNEQGTKGMLSAGHCQNTQSYWWFSGGGPVEAHGFLATPLMARQKVMSTGCRSTHAFGTCDS